MTSRPHHSFNISLSALLLVFLGVACPGVDGSTDAGNEPEPEAVTCGPSGEPCTCETEDDSWPGPLTIDGLDLFAESGCTKVSGGFRMTPGMLSRASELSAVKSVRVLEVTGTYPNGTNLSELAFLEDIDAVIVRGANGVSSLSGLVNIAALDIGVQVEAAPDFETIGMENLRSIGIPEPGFEVVLNAAVQLVDLPSLETLGLPSDYALVAGPMVLKRLPNLDADEARDLIAQYTALSAEERNPSPGSSPPTVICELDEAVGNGADAECPAEYQRLRRLHATQSSARYGQRRRARPTVAEDFARARRRLPSGWTRV